MKLIYHEIFRNDMGFLECNLHEYPYVERFTFINQEYCDNGKWLNIYCFDGNEFSISVGNDDEFEILGESK